MNAIAVASKSEVSQSLRDLFALYRLPERSTSPLLDSKRELETYLQSGGFPVSLKLAVLEDWRKERVTIKSVTETYLLSRLLCSIEPAEIERNFGSDAILWALSVSQFRPTYMQEVKVWLENKGYSPEDMAAAGRALQIFDSYDQSVELLLQTYELSRRLRAGTHGVASLQSLLVKNTEPPLEISPNKLARYQLEPFTLDQECSHHGYLTEWTEKDFTSGKGFKRYDNLYADQTFGLLLLYDGQPQAIVSFVPRDQNTLYVVQLQGQKASVVNAQGEPMEDDNGNPLYVGSRGLVPLQLPSFLLELAIEFAKAQGFSKLLLRGAENSGWTQGDPEVLEKFLRIYDTNAEEHGFVQCEDGNWVTNLP